MRGMTGYSQKTTHIQLPEKDITLSIEIKSYNNRYLDVSVHLPKDGLAYDNKIRALLRSHISHAKVDFILTWKNLGKDKLHKINIEEAVYVYNELKILSQKIPLNAISLENLLHFPDVLNVAHSDALLTWEELEPYCLQSIESLQAEYLEEGQIIEENIAELLLSFQQSYDKICHLAQHTKDDFPALLERKMQIFNKNFVADSNKKEKFKVDVSRLEQEVALLLVKTDLNEELVRIKSYMEKAREFTHGSEQDVSKKFDFLCQEMNRECNTINSKTHLLDISHEIINMKLYIEQIREQLRNVQ